MIQDILIDHTYRTRSGESCKVIGVIGESVIFISQELSPAMVEEMPRKLFQVCVVEDVSSHLPRA